MCGVSQPTISRLLSGETDERSLRVSTLVAIHDALKCTWVELLGTDYVC
jgi:transcriptional regulator with XRE-family HTH domain